MSYSRCYSWWSQQSMLLIRSHWRVRQQHSSGISLNLHQLPLQHCKQSFERKGFWKNWNNWFHKTRQRLTQRQSKLPMWPARKATILLKKFPSMEPRVTFAVTAVFWKPPKSEIASSHCWHALQAALQAWTEGSTELVQSRMQKFTVCLRARTAGESLGCK